jgi:conjugal transfer ATP-binding protein TraC
MLILSGIIWNLVMKDRAAKKVVVFDEVWRLLESPPSARLVAELYRTSRKYRASILTISQAVEDFTSSPIATALTNNSATVYLLKHRRGHELVAQQFHLNVREEEIFRGLEMRRGEYTEALVLHGDHHFLARIVLTPLEYWIATSHPADLELEAELGRAQPHLSRLDRLRLLAARFPRGAATAQDPAADAA